MTKHNAMCMCGKWMAPGRKHCRTCTNLIISGLICDTCGMYYNRPPYTPRVMYTNHCVWCEEDGGAFKIANVIQAAGHWVTVRSMLGEPEAA